MEDKELLDKIVKKDERAFQVFVEKYHQLVLNVCNNILNNFDDAMDISQEVFIKAFESVESFRGDSKVSTWLYRISVNKSLNYLRAKKRQKWLSSIDVIFGDNNDKNSPVDNGLQPGEQIEQDENKKALHLALRKLPTKQNIALTLHNFEDLPYKEISEIMQVSVTEVGVLINRGKRNLKRILINYYQNN